MCDSSVTGYGYFKRKKTVNGVLSGWEGGDGAAGLLKQT